MKFITNFPFKSLGTGGIKKRTNIFLILYPFNHFSLIGYLKVSQMILTIRTVQHIIEIILENLLGKCYIFVPQYLWGVDSRTLPTNTDTKIHGCSNPLLKNGVVGEMKPAYHHKTTEALAPRARAPQQEKPLQWEACALQQRVVPAHHN